MGDTPLLLFDDDCGICTKFARVIARLLSDVEVIRMSDERMMQIGIDVLGKEMYWRSFHVVRGDLWTSEGEAITELVSLFPLGKIWRSVMGVTPITRLSVQLLRHFQRRRKLECRIP